MTIFGQSGGGMKVTVLGQIPEAEGLFHKMIVMSGVVKDDFVSTCTPKELVLEVLKNLRIEEKNDVEKLEKVPVPQFIWAVNQATKALEAQGKQINWSPCPTSTIPAIPSMAVSALLR